MFKKKKKLNPTHLVRVTNLKICKYIHTNLDNVSSMIMLWTKLPGDTFMAGWSEMRDHLKPKQTHARLINIYSMCHYKKPAGKI